MSKRPVAAVLVGLVSVSSVLSGCAGLCGPDATSSACSSSTTPEVHNHYYEDDDSEMLPIAITVASVALIATVIAISNKNDAPSAAPHRPESPQPAAYVIAAPTPENAAEIRLQRMYVQGHLSARAGRCEATIAIARQMARTAPDYYQTYAADPTIAACLVAPR
jgi:hypothetical protein